MSSANSNAPNYTTKNLNSRVCHGFVRHRRHIGKRHQFKYKVYMMLLDLSEVKYIFKPFIFWSYNKFNLVSFWPKKYFDRKEQDLFHAVKNYVHSQINIYPDQVKLLTNLSCLGYCFNPISIYFCYHNNKLVAGITEVSNTPWGQTKRYFFQPEQHSTKQHIYKASFKKQLHVSPFMSMEYQYLVSIKYSDEQIIIHIKNIKQYKTGVSQASVKPSASAVLRGESSSLPLSSQSANLISVGNKLQEEDHTCENEICNICDFDATLSLYQSPMNHKNLALTLLKFPMMTGKVIIGIYWQALKIFLKKNKFYPNNSTGV